MPSLDLTLTKKQKMFVDATEMGVDETFFGGAAGGGKSYVQVADSAVYAATYPKSKQLLLRRTYPELEQSIIRTFLETVPKEMYTYNSQKHMVTFKNGSILDFGFCATDDDVHKYMSQEVDCLRFDEAGTFTPYQYKYLRSRVRGANKFPHLVKSTGNPGGPNHVFLRERFVEPAPPCSPFEVKVGRKMEKRLFIPCKVTENPFLMDADPDYLARLEDLPEEERRQLLEGDWYVFSGQFFPEFSRDVHVFRERPKLDKDWRIYFTCDYGLDCYAAYFIGVDQRENAYVLGEVYEPNVIISDAAKMAKEKAKELGIKKVDEWLAPSDLWNRRQETGRSVADIFYENGIRLYKTSRDRIDGWAAMKEYLKPVPDGQGGMTAKLLIHESCVNLIRCVPALQYDQRRPSDAATTPHEITHAPDALRGFCVYRARANRILPEKSERQIWEERQEQFFTSQDMYNVYGVKENRYDDTDNGAGYNPMYL